jgi:hypothetical protein
VHHFLVGITVITLGDEGPLFGLSYRRKLTMKRMIREMHQNISAGYRSILILEFTDITAPARKKERPWVRWILTFLDLASPAKAANWIYSTILGDTGEMEKLWATALASSLAAFTPFSVNL